MTLQQISGEDMGQVTSGRSIAHFMATVSGQTPAEYVLSEGVWPDGRAPFSEDIAAYVVHRVLNSDIKLGVVVQETAEGEGEAVAFSPALAPSPKLVDRAIANIKRERQLRIAPVMVANIKLLEQLTDG